MRSKNSNMGCDAIFRLFAVLCAVGLAGLCVLMGALGIVWWLMETHVGPEATRFWAITATALLLPTALGGYFFGRRDSSNVLAGIRAGVDEVMGAATRASSIRVGTTRALRASPSRAVNATPQIELPEVHELRFRDRLDDPAALLAQEDQILEM